MSDIHQDLDLMKMVAAEQARKLDRAYNIIIKNPSDDGKFEKGISTYELVDDEYYNANRADFVHVSRWTKRVANEIFLDHPQVCTLGLAPVPDPGHITALERELMRSRPSRKVGIPSVSSAFNMDKPHVSVDAILKNAGVDPSIMLQAGNEYLSVHKMLQETVPEYDPYYKEKRVPLVFPVVTEAQVHKANGLKSFVIDGHEYWASNETVALKKAQKRRKKLNPQPND